MTGNQLAYQVITVITDAMETLGVDRAELARRLGTSRAAVTQLFRGGNFETATLAKVSSALGLECWFALGSKREVERSFCGSCPSVNLEGNDVDDQPKAVLYSQYIAVAESLERASRALQAEKAKNAKRTALILEIRRMFVEARFAPALQEGCVKSSIADYVRMLLKWSKGLEETRDAARAEARAKAIAECVKELRRRADHAESTGNHLPGTDQAMCLHAEARALAKAATWLMESLAKGE